jgi:O-antigen/teichoic acid export membrane protein
MGKGFVGQTLLLMSGQGFAKGLSFISFLLIARALGPDLYGAFTFAFVFGSLLAFVPNMGVDPYYAREVCARRAEPRSLMGVALILKIVGSVVFLLIYDGGVFCTTRNASAWEASKFIGPGLTLLSLSLIGKTVLVTSSRAGVAGLLDAVQSGMFLLLAVLVVRIFPSISWAAGAFLIAQLAGVVLGAATVWRIVGVPQFPRDPLVYVNTVRKTVPLALLWFLSDIYLRIGSTMLFYLRGDLETGLYGASYRLVEGVYSATLVVCSTSLPRFSQAWSYNVSAWMKEWWRGLFFVLSLILLPAILFTAVPQAIITLLYGQSFAKAASSLRFLGPATFVLCMGSIFGIALTSIGEERNQLKITFIALLSNVFLNFLLIPVYGGIGAALATLISGMVYLLLGQISLSRTIKDTQKEDESEPIDSRRR